MLVTLLFACGIMVVVTRASPSTVAAPQHHLHTAEAGAGAEQYRVRLSELPGARTAGPSSQAHHQDNHDMHGSGHFSGYLNVSYAPSNGLDAFFYYVQHPDPTKPLVVWMNGGPGASSLTGLFTELGPLLLNGNSKPTRRSATESSKVKDDEWTLFDNPYSWSQQASLVAWEQPAGVGFSRCTGDCPLWNDDTSADANLLILLEFLKQFPEAGERPLYVVGESYGGIYVPMLASRVHDYNNKQDNKVKLKGVGIGNGCIGYGVEGGCGLDQLELLLSVVTAIGMDIDKEVVGNTWDKCDGELNKGLSPNQLSEKCKPAMKAFFQELGDYNTYHWATSCGPDDQGNWGDGSHYACEDGLLSKWTASASVQRALHIISGDEKVRTWNEWDGQWMGYNITMADAQPIYRSLLKNGYSMLIYNGLRDTAVPYLGAVKWLPRVAGTVTTPRRKWAGPSGHVAGHATTYSTGLTWVTLQGAGHLVPGDRPQEAQAMLNAFLAGEPMPPYKDKPCKLLWLGRGYGDFCSDEL